MALDIKGDKVVLSPGSFVEEDYSYYGRLRGGGLELSFVEAAFLIERDRLETSISLKEFLKRASSIQPSVDLKYIVYKDLRERGYYVQPSVTDFRLYPRGGRPGEGAASSYVYVLSERIPIRFADLVQKVKLTQSVRKKMLLAVVDGESDLTYYEAKSAHMRGKMAPLTVDLSATDATLLDDRVVIWDQQHAVELYEAGFYGKLVDEQSLQLSLLECAYLMRFGLPVEDGATSKRFTVRQFTRRAKAIEPEFVRKLDVYTDLRDNGLVVKTGFKFGSHFRVYEQVIDVRAIPHSKYLVHALPDDFVVMLPEMSRAVRLAHGVRKRMVFAYTTTNGFEYLDIGRAKP